MFRRSEVVRWLRDNLKEKRYLHVMGVLKTARELAAHYGVSVEKAETAALFHDYAKNFTDVEMDKFLQNGNVETGTEFLKRRSVNLYHGFVSAMIAEKEYGIIDDDVLSAIRNHTFGRPGMSELEKIIYLSDLIEPSRTFEGVEEIRRAAFQNLDRAMLMALDKTLKYLIDKGEIINLESVEARNAIIEDIRE